MSNASEVALSPTSISQRLNGSSSRMRRGASLTLTMSDDELESTMSKASDRIKSDRLPLTKPEEDNRRRTIIVEKKNGSYGFTLQSYGIHYKKVQEVEMITYVDFIEYDGPAYKAGMREGDVILSINGTDMEKADHKTLVAFIKECDSFMRMVVLFEDCVRKVGLHVRYIQLQNVLQAKMSELERICIREHELLQGKWKTHSLPARKKTTTSPTATNEGEDISPDKPTPYVRSTLSTEDINTAERHQSVIIPPPTQFMLAYQYLSPNCRYAIRPSTSNSGEYLVSIGPAFRGDYNIQFVQRSSSTENNSTIEQHSTTTPSAATSQQNLHKQKQHESRPQNPNSKGMRYTHGHFCNPCIRHPRKEHDGADKDNVSLDAYDLASPCCEPHCVPKRRSRHKEHHHKHKHRENKERPRPKSQSHVPPTPPNQHRSHHEKHSHRPQHYYDLNSGLASHCSLHSCNSSEYAADNSGTSHMTTLSNDTLHWDPNNESQRSSVQQLQQQSSGAATKRPGHPQFIHRYYPHAAQIQPAPPRGYQTNYVQKPKSWDNLTTKSFGGYGFGYYHFGGETAKQNPNMTTKIQANPNTAGIPPQPNPMIQPRKNVIARYSTFCEVENYAPPPTQFIQQITMTTTSTTILAKSTENLIGTPTYGGDKKGGYMCDCFDEKKTNSLKMVNTHDRPALKSTGSSNEMHQSCGGGYMNSHGSQMPVSNGSKNVSTTSEVTRL